MCGVVGYWPRGKSLSGGMGARRLLADAEEIFHRLMYESRVRGMHAYGIAQRFNDFKPPIVGAYLRSRDLNEVVESFDPVFPAVAHARYSTSGDYTVEANNQPIVAENIMFAFNGVIHQGTKEEFEQAFDVQCVADNDGEIFVRKLAAQIDPVQFLRDTSCSFAGVWIQNNMLHALRNDERPLWTATSPGAYWIASTRDILLRARLTEPSEIPALLLMRHRT